MNLVLLNVAICLPSIYVQFWHHVSHNLLMLFFSQEKYNKQKIPIVDVVVDPHLSVHLRPHQRDGIAFLYECVMDMRCYGGVGAILAYVVHYLLFFVVAPSPCHSHCVS